MSELVHQRFECGDFAADERGAFLDGSGQAVVEGTGALALDQALKALGGELDGRQGILDFVRQALRDFLPGSGFLRLKQLAEVFQHQD